MFESVIWIVPVAVATAGLWKPRAGLLVLAASLPFFGSAPGGPYLAALDVAGVAAIATTWRPGWRASRVERSSLDWPVAAWVVVSLVSLLPLAYHPPSWQPSALFGLVKTLPEVPTATVLYTWRALLNLLLGWGLYRAVRRTFVRESLSVLGAAVGVGLALALVFGLAEHTGLVDLSSYRAIGGPLYETRLHSFFFHSGWFAEYIVVALPFVVACMMVEDARRKRLGLALLVLALVALAFTEQRGAWFAALAQLTVLASISGARLIRDRRALWPAVTVVLGVVAVASVLMVSRPETASPLLKRLGESTANLSGRPHLWSVSTQMLAERPLLGWGLGAFAPAYDLVHPRGSPEAWPYRDTAHSLYFNLAAERGLLGLLTLAALACALVLGLGHCVRSNRHPKSVIGLGLLISGAGFAVNGLVQYMFYLKNIEWLFWILLGAASLLSGSRGHRWLDRGAQGLIIATVLLLPWRAFWLEAIPGPGDRSFGFHELEASPGGNVRWSTGHAARWLRWEDEILVVKLANGHPRANEHPTEVILRIDGREQFRETLRGGWEEHRVELGPPQRHGVVVEWEVQPIFRPFVEFRNYPDLAPSIDVRSLGIAVGEIRWESADTS